MLLWRIVDRDLKLSADAFDYLAQPVELNREDRSHCSFGALFVGLPAGIQESERLIEVERPDMDEMVVLPEAETEGESRGDSCHTQALAIHVVGQEDTDLDVAIPGEHRLIVHAKMGTQVAAEYVRGAIKNFAIP